MVMLSPEPTVGGVRIPLIFKENASETVLAMPETVTTFEFESQLQDTELRPSPETALQPGAEVEIMAAAKGSLVQKAGIEIASCPPEGIWSLGLMVKVRVAALLTQAPPAEMEQAKSIQIYI